MTTDDLIKHFGSAKKAYVHLGVSPQLWHAWCKTGISPKTQAELQIRMENVLLVGKRIPAKRFRSRVTA